MTRIHLRCVNDEKGDVVDLAWYCSSHCYYASLVDEPPSATFEEGGEYPGGAESDYNDYCSNCGTLVREGMSD